MSTPTAESFLSHYPTQVVTLASQLRTMLLATLPDVIEQVDVSAKMVAYAYGPKYPDMVCTIIPSKKGLKLGFYKGTELPDPDGLLEGTGKISRYVVIDADRDVPSPALKNLVKAALSAYRERSNSAAK